MELLGFFEFGCCITFPSCFYLSLDILESLWIHQFMIFEGNMSDNFQSWGRSGLQTIETSIVHAYSVAIHLAGLCEVFANGTSMAL